MKSSRAFLAPRGPSRVSSLLFLPQVGTDLTSNCTFVYLIFLFLFLEGFLLLLTWFFELYINRIIQSVLFYKLFVGPPRVCERHCVHIAAVHTSVSSPLCESRGSLARPAAMGSWASGLSSLALLWRMLPWASLPMSSGRHMCTFLLDNAWGLPEQGHTRV